MSQHNPLSESTRRTLRTPTTQVASAINSNNNLVERETEKIRFLRSNYFFAVKLID
jgi:hypothetical protein